MVILNKKFKHFIPIIKYQFTVISELYLFFFNEPEKDILNILSMHK